MNLIVMKYLPGTRVRLLVEVESDKPVDLKEGVIVGLKLTDFDINQDVEYAVRFGDWVLEGIKEHEMERL